MKTNGLSVQIPLLLCTMEARSLRRQCRWVKARNEVAVWAQHVAQVALGSKLHTQPMGWPSQSYQPVTSHREGSGHSEQPLLCPGPQGS